MLFEQPAAANPKAQNQQLANGSLRPVKSLESCGYFAWRTVLQSVLQFTSY